MLVVYRVTDPQWTLIETHLYVGVWGGGVVERHGEAASGDRRGARGSRQGRDATAGHDRLRVAHASDSSPIGEAGVIG